MGATQSEGTVDEQVDTDQQTSTGLDESIAATLSYVLGWLTGIVMFLVESDNDHVRFHAAQSIVVFGGASVLLFALSIFQGVMAVGGALGGVFSLVIGPLLGLVSIVVWIGMLILWIFLLVRTYQGQDPRIPVAAGIAEGFA